DLAADDDEPSNRYADAEFGRSAYIANLCRRLGVEDLHTLWDTLFELDPGLSVEAYLERCHAMCSHMRLLEGPGRETDRWREAYMAARVREAMQRHAGQLLVVTGGYHSIALHARLTGAALPGVTEPAECPRAPEGEGEERGIALTPYSFERLD